MSDHATYLDQIRLSKKKKLNLSKCTLCELNIINVTSGFLRVQIPKTNEVILSLFNSSISILIGVFMVCDWGWPIEGPPLHQGQTFDRSRRRNSNYSGSSQVMTPIGCMVPTHLHSPVSTQFQTSISTLLSQHNSRHPSLHSPSSSTLSIT